MARLDSLYSRLPVWAQHCAVTAFGLYWNRLRFGPGYHQLVQAYASRDGFSATEWAALQREQLGRLLVAAAVVPYFRETWGRSELAAARAGRLEDLPLLEKRPLRQNPEAFLRPDMHPRPRLVFHTSGSTGTPIATIWTTLELRDSLAVREVRSARWAGVSFSQPRATFSGRLVEPDPQSKGPFHRFNLVERQTYLSAFHLRPDTASQYVESLRRHGVRWMTGYAISYYLLAKFMLAQAIEPPPSLQAVITTSEKVTPAMRQVMEAAYGCRVYEEYSNVENSLFVSECERARLHVSPDVGVVEILRPDGTPCEPGEPGEVVTTCLMRHYQPMIRYRVGDMAAWDGEPCPCGREMPVLKEVVGRVEDVVVGPDSRQMVRFHGIFVDQPHVQEGQIVQEAVDRIRVKTVPTPGFGPNDEHDIVRRIQQRLGPEVHVVVELVKEIPRTKSGKFKAVVSLLDATGQNLDEPSDATHC